MIDIVGGVYLERCHWPPRRALYGSGGRAAAAISQLVKPIRLHTYIGDREREALRSIASSYGFFVQTSEIPQTIAFDYFHGLSVPTITPAHRKPTRPLNVTGNFVLRFGFIEGDAVVNGETVVYDPQNVLHPTLFTANGSRADRLAVILNRGEGALLSQKKNPHDIVKAVADAESAEVVVLKLGPLGAMVWERGKVTTVPCFKTDYVWPIGSGDVFAAVFFSYWAKMRRRAVEAAHRASYAAALYCNSEVLPISRKQLQTKAFQPVVAKSRRETLSRGVVYLAGPFFTIAQRWLVEEVRSALLGMGLRVFSPLHDVGHGAASDVAIKDIKGLEKSTAVFAIVDGLDSGTLFEVGYARAKGIPVVALVQNESADAVKMIEGSGCVMEGDLVSAIYKTVWAVLRDL